MVFIVHCLAIKLKLKNIFLKIHSKSKLKQHLKTFINFQKVAGNAANVLITILKEENNVSDAKKIKIQMTMMVNLSTCF